MRFLRPAAIALSCTVALLFGLPAAAVAAPPNDAYDDAIEIAATGGEHVGDAHLAERDPGETGNREDDDWNWSVWFSWTAPASSNATYPVRIELCGDDADSEPQFVAQLAVLTAASGINGEPVAYAKDGCDPQHGAEPVPTLTLTATQNTEYRIAVGSAYLSDDAGSYRIRVVHLDSDGDGHADYKDAYPADPAKWQLPLPVDPVPPPNPTLPNPVGPIPPGPVNPIGTIHSFIAEVLNGVQQAQLCAIGLCNGAPPITGVGTLTGSPIGEVLMALQGGAIHCNGGGGNDACIGGRKNDTCIAGSGNDLCFGKQGNDRCVSSAGSDRCFGEGGRDSCTARSGGVPILEKLWTLCSGGAGSDVCAVMAKAGIKQPMKTDFICAGGPGADSCLMKLQSLGLKDQIKSVCSGGAGGDRCSVVGSAGAKLAQMTCAGAGGNDGCASKVVGPAAALVGQLVKCIGGTGDDVCTTTFDSKVAAKQPKFACAGGDGKDFGFLANGKPGDFFNGNGGRDTCIYDTGDIVVNCEKKYEVNEAFLKVDGEQKDYSEEYRRQLQLIQQLLEQLKRQQAESMLKVIG